jgi:hypothetical protein
VRLIFQPSGLTLIQKPWDSMRRLFMMEKKVTPSLLSRYRELKEAGIISEIHDVFRGTIEVRIGDETILKFSSHKEGREMFEELVDACPELFEEK